MSFCQSFCTFFLLVALWALVDGWQSLHLSAAQQLWTRHSPLYTTGKLLGPLCSHALKLAILNQKGLKSARETWICTCQAPNEQASHWLINVEIHCPIGPVDLKDSMNNGSAQEDSASYVLGQVEACWDHVFLPCVRVTKERLQIQSWSDSQRVVRVGLFLFKES